MSPGDIIFWHDEKFGHHRFWEIEGVYLGAEGQESLIAIRSLTEKPGTVAGLGYFATTFVPEPLLRNATVYTPTGTAARRADLTAPVPWSNQS